MVKGISYNSEHADGLILEAQGVCTDYRQNCSEEHTSPHPHLEVHALLSDHYADHTQCTTPPKRTTSTYPYPIYAKHGRNTPPPHLEVRSAGCARCQILAAHYVLHTHHITPRHTLHQTQQNQPIPAP
jgi:hypothetical protein